MGTENIEKTGLKNNAISRILDELVTRITTVVHPLQIILFGSAARGAMGTHSDLDILVVMPNGTHRRQTVRLIHRALAELGVPKDIIVVTESDLSEYGTNSSLIIEPAMTGGKELYRAVA